MVATGDPYPTDARREDFAGWRDATVVGTPSDGNAAHALGGVAGHAGLFATVPELLRLGRSLVDPEVVPTSVIAEFARPLEVAPDRGLGLRLTTISLAGQQIPFVFHPGFTGAWLGVALDRDLVIAVAATRLHTTTGSITTPHASRSELVTTDAIAEHHCCPGECSPRIRRPPAPDWSPMTTTASSTPTDARAGHDDALLSVRGLTVTFATPHGPVSAVRDVSLEIRRGETVAVVGESGSGKSTLAAGGQPAARPATAGSTAGTIWFDERDLTRLGDEGHDGDPRRRRIGMVPQDPMSNLNPVMRVGDQIAEALEVHGGATGRAARERGDRAARPRRHPGRRARAAQYPHEFSGGMRQRVLIAIGARLPPGAADRRRADLGARRHRAAPHPRPPRRAHRRDGHRGRAHHARPRPRGRACRPGGGDAPRRDRRERRRGARSSPRHSTSTPSALLGRRARA